MKNQPGNGLPYLESIRLNCDYRMLCSYSQVRMCAEHIFFKNILTRCQNKNIIDADTMSKYKNMVYDCE